MTIRHAAISRRNLILGSTATAALAACGGGGTQDSADDSLERESAQFSATCGPTNARFTTRSQAQWSARFDTVYG